MIDPKVFMYLKKLYLLFGNGWWQEDYIMESFTPFRDEFIKNGWNLDTFEPIYIAEYFEGEYKTFYSSGKYKFTEKFIKYMEENNE